MVTPWKIRQTYTNGEPQELVIHEGAQDICSILIGSPYDEQRDAARIVNSVNQHDDLVRALKQILAWHQAGCDPSRKALLEAERVIALAEQHWTVHA